MKITFCFMTLLICFSFNYDVFAEQSGIDANALQLKQAVPFELAIFAAEHEAKQFCGAMKFYSSTTCYDVNGLPDVYCIILGDPNIAVPDMNNISEQLHHHHSKIKEAKKAITMLAAQDISGKKKAEQLAQLNEQIRESRNVMADANSFATFYCGATEDHVPVIRCHRGLPEHIVILPELEEEIGSKADLSGMKLGKVLYFGIFDIGYELVPAAENDKSGQSQVTSASEKRFTDKTKFILVKSKKTITKAELKGDIEKRLAAQVSDTENANALKAKQEERKKIVQEKWQRIRRMYEQK